MRFLFLLMFTSLSLLPAANAQLANGSIAPDVTFTDINGNTHNLYSILDQGKSVVFDAFATWCGICWNYDNTGIIKNLYNTYGPPGTDEIAVFAIEASPSTNAPCIYGPTGCTGSTIGDWATGTPYPIVHIESGNQADFSSLYQIGGYPTLYKICPNKKIYNIGQATTQTWVNWISSCSLEGEGQSSAAVCFNDGNSGVDLTVSGGFGALNYNWSNGTSTQDLTNVAPGSYEVTVTDSQGHAVEMGPFLVDGPTSNINTTLTQQGDVNCFGDGTGFIEINVFGGSGNYQYNWSSGENTQDIYNLDGGVYSLTLTDGFGCTDVFLENVSEPTALSLTGSTVAESCSQGNGMITLFAAGGSSGYLYDIGNGNSSINVFTGLSAGNYVATLTDVNGCETMAPFVVDAEPAPTAVAGANVLIDCTTSVVTLSGAGSSTGPNIAVIWTTTDGNIVSGATTLTPTIDQPGTYINTITNQTNGCSAQDEVVVTGDVIAPDADAGPDGLLNCTNTSYTLSGSSATNNVVYEWFESTGVMIASTPTVEVTNPGEYELIVTNQANGCTSSDNASVTVDVEIPVASATTTNIIDCLNNSTELVGSAMGGTNLDVAWFNANNELLGNTNTIVVNQAGDYTFQVTNPQNGCEASSTTEVLVDVNMPTADAGSNKVLTCVESEVTIGGNSSTGSNYNYSWTNDNNEVVGNTETINVSEPGNYFLTVNDLTNGCESNSSVQVWLDQTVPLSDAGEDMHLTVVNTEVTIGGNSSTGVNINYSWQNANGVEIGYTATIAVQNPGEYFLIVTNDENGCYSEDLVVVTQNITVPTADAGANAILDCNVSTVMLGGSGSSVGSTISYQWLNENGTVIGNEIMVEVGSAGTYTLEVMDSSCDCMSTDMVIVQASTDVPTAVAGTNGELNCIISEVILSAQGSSSGANFDYSWFDSQGGLLGAGQIITVQEAGSYSLVVTNGDNGCESSISVLVNENQDEPVADIQAPATLHCNNSEVLLDATTSSGNDLQYEWLSTTGLTLGTDATLTVTQAGLYYLAVTDGINGCQDQALVAVQNSNAPIATIASIGYINCNGGTDGTITASYSGGQAPFEFLWSDGQETLSAINLAAGFYELTVTDANGCTAIAEGIVSDPPLLEVTVQSTGETGEGLNDGTAAASASGGIGNYSYSWSNMQSGASIQNLTPGSYQVTVSDENDCEAIEIINITAFNCALQVQTSHEDIQCNGMANGQISISVLQGDAVSYNWDNGADGAELTNLSAGTYSYTVSDASNCEVEGTVTISEPTMLENSISNVMNISCGSGLGGSATANPTGGTAPYDFIWSNGEQTQTATQLVAGNNTLAITDANGCVIDAAVMITADDNEDPIALAQSVTVNLDANGNASVTPAMVNNGSSDNCGIASLELSTSNFDCTGVGVNTVELTVTDLSGNSSKITAEITVVDNIVPQINCSGSFTVGECDKVFFNEPTVVDNCDNWSLTLLAGFPSGSSFPAGSTTITYRVTDVQGNMADCSFEVNLAMDFAAIVESNDALCAGDASGTAIALASGGTLGYQYQWSNGQETAEANGLAAGMHNVQVIDAVGCIETINFEIDEPTALTFNLDDLQDDATGMGSGSVDITIDGGTPPYNYVWTLDGIFHSTDEDLTGLTEGNYGVEVIDANGCELAQFGMNVENLVHATESQYAKDISIQPNPTTDVAQVYFELSEGLEVQLELYSIRGELLQQKDLGVVREKVMRLDMAALASGVYNLRLLVGDEVVVKRVVVQR